MTKGWPEDFRTPAGVWYREAPLSDLCVFGRRFDDIVREYRENLRRGPEASADSTLMTSDGLPEHLADRLRDLAAEDPNLLRRWADTFRSSPFAARLLHRGIGNGPIQDEPSGGTEDDDDDADGPDDPPRRFDLPREPAPEGLVRICFMESESITPNQEDLYRWLLAEQARVADDVRDALAKTAHTLEESYATALDDDGSKLLATSSNEGRHGDMIRLSRIELDPVEPIAGLYFECTWSEVLLEDTSEFAVFFYRSGVVAYGDMLGLTFDNDFLDSATDDIVNRIGI